MDQGQLDIWYSLKKLPILFMESLGFKPHYRSIYTMNDKKIMLMVLGAVMSKKAKTGNIS